MAILGEEVCSDVPSQPRQEALSQARRNEIADERGIRMIQGIKIHTHFIGARRDVVLITVLGYVDTTTCQELTKEINALVEQEHHQIIADLGGVSYISSAGWGVFVGEIKNVRDRGGDIKIVQMSTEVFEVFEMLEFNRILNHYQTIEEAVDEFDIMRGIDITKPDESVKQTGATIEYPESHIRLEPSKKSGKKKEPTKPTIPVKDFPLVEKVKRIVVENPLRNVREMRRILNTPEYGSVRIGGLRLRSMLRKLNLETKAKRYRFYRSR